MTATWRFLKKKLQKKVNFVFNFIPISLVVNNSFIYLDIHCQSCEMLPHSKRCILCLIMPNVSICLPVTYYGKQILHFGGVALQYHNLELEGNFDFSSNSWVIFWIP